jgi:hypothetical protein
MRQCGKAVERLLENLGGILRSDSGGFVSKHLTNGINFRGYPSLSLILETTPHSFPRRIQIAKWGGGGIYFGSILETTACGRSLNFSETWENLPVIVSLNCGASQSEVVNSRMKSGLDRKVPAI